MRVFAPGTFGHVTTQLGLSWFGLGRACGIEHTTIMRWAVANQAGRVVTVHCDPKKVCKLFAAINIRDKYRGGFGQYTMHSFGFRWPTSGKVADMLLQSQTVLGGKLQTLNEELVRHDSPRAQYQQLVEVGRKARSEIDRRAWDIAWQGFCRTTFSHLPNMYKTPPHGVDWYQP